MGTDNKSRFLRDAEKYVAGGKIPQAIAEYQKILRNDPNDILILNTVGDLYLKAGKVEDARRLFFQVAEHYSNNKFLLKAIAVYKKILATDPSDLAINAQIAGLYARQGMNVDARIQYLNLAGLYSRDGKAREAVEAYEKVIELDPKNSDVRLKLAAIYLEQGDQGRARFCYTGAAKAQAKTGDIKGASASYERALQVAPCDLESLKGYLEVSLELGETAPALSRIKPHINEIQDDAALTELLGRAYLAAGDAEGAMVHLERIFCADGSGCDYMMEAGRTFMESGQFDRATDCLERVTSVFISRREPGRALKGITRILESNPSHVPTLRLQAKIYSAMNEEGPYLDTLDKIVGACRANGQPGAALEHLERIIEYHPESREHLELHERLFAEAHPGMTYLPPNVSRKSRQRDAEVSQDALADDKGSSAVFVEIDLLMNYGMHDKANQLLRDLVMRDPWNKEARLRLAEVFRKAGSMTEAGEQLLLAAALSVQSGNELEADRGIAEAHEIAPNLVASREELAAFAKKHGITITQAPRQADKLDHRSISSGEIDLSVDLTEVFFSDSPEPAEIGAEESGATRFGAGEDEFPTAPTQEQGLDSLAEQLQEVDFYIRLGFSDEAKSKLDEISRSHPDSPELAARYFQLSAAGGAPPQEYGGHSASEHDERSCPQHETAAGDEQREPDFGGFLDDAPEIEMDLSALESAAAEGPKMIALPGELEVTEEETPPESAPAEVRSGLEVAEGVNKMFADLIDEVNSLTSLEIAREDHETHYSLGVAYREMDLLEEAIKEFQTAMKALDPTRSPREAIQCSGMLTTCFLEKGMPRSAIRWCQTGLKIPEITPHERLALQYDMGVAHSMAGETDWALECFGGIFRADPTYRDVAQRIDELKGGTKRNGAWDPAQAPDAQHRRQK